MTQTIYTVKVTRQFKKDYKSAQRRGLSLKMLDEVITKLATGQKLPEANRDHALSGNWIGHRECHISPDWLLIYRLEDKVLVLSLTRTGSHSALFGK